MLSYLQRVGSALMVPVATLPAAAILFGIGYGLDPSGSGHVGWIASLLIQSGLAVTEHMPALFAIGVAYGLSRDKDGAAALSGFIGYLVVTRLCQPETVAMIMSVPSAEFDHAFTKIDNQFVGILSGIISSIIYNRFSQVKLPDALSFFSGRRLVPILVSLVMMLVALILMLIWPVLYASLVSFGKYIQMFGATGAGIYACLNRLLIPLGLHHALNSVFWFDVVGINDIPNFLGGQHAIATGQATPGITGQYQAGFFPIMMFGLPGAALAIWHCAKPEARARVAGIMLAAAFASFFTGITEPLEFTFMFAAPVLYGLHALLTGLSVFIAASMHWMAGFGFSAGLVDIILASRNPLSTQWYMLLVQGMLFFIIYYLLFRFTILKFNLKTLGRADDDVVYTHKLELANSANNTQSLAEAYLRALGGKENLVEVDACITRLRLKVNHDQAVNEVLLKTLGASAIVRVNTQTVQVVVGTQAEQLSWEIKKRIQNASAEPITPSPHLSELGFPDELEVHQSKTVILAPVSGKLLSLSEVADTVFSTLALGPAMAILPDTDVVVAPASGNLVSISHTNHAFCLETDQGVKVLVHIGLNTIALQGRGFARLVEPHRRVRAGEPILKLDLDYLKQNARSLASAVLIINSDEFTIIEQVKSGEVVAGETTLLRIKKRQLSNS